MGGSTKASKLREIPAKASTTHSGMTAVTFLADEEAWSMKLGCASVTGLSKGSSKSGSVECNYSEFHTSNVRHIDILTLSRRHTF